MTSCELCETTGGELLWQDAFCRAILVDDRDYPGFCRVIWHEHIKEMSDLTAVQQNRLMRVVFAVEAALRDTLKPEKINLASLGNVVPHLHWHVIPRFRNDKHFPNPIWGEARRESSVSTDNNLIAGILKAALAQRLS
ncbi:HIT family protein [Sulfuriferula sp. AH1]|uniref:HIT family protein n=1 Tax=Sulfuriferula sp. AH1 TaxID=1985873 RepID=UPI000B3B8B69|nr:HIT family protein [Sulfuriferula sp. AH1]ARU30994.1 HIT family protein [Sulfuriferula sp. AH1]